MSHLVAIVGPTAIGKSKLAIRLAQAFNGEIVSADSRQVYRFMDIGTAKPGPDELSLTPHHLINIINPDEDFSLAQYQKLAHQTIRNIQKHGKLAILAGGSGQYVWSLLEGWGVPRVPPDPELRQRLEKKASGEGKDKLYQELREVDPTAAQGIDPANVRRVIRALEVYHSTGIPISRLQQKKAPPYKVLIIGLTADRAHLYQRTDARIGLMIENGLINETENLVNMGYHYELSAMSGIGYRQIGMYLRGELELDDAVRQIQTVTHRLVRQQYTWFRLNDEHIHWFDIKEDIENEVATLIKDFAESS